MQSQTEFRYRDHSGQDHAAWLLAAGLWLLFASLITGAWGIMALAHASWLHASDLPNDDATLWGVTLLGVATIQGISGLLVIFDRPAGSYLGIAITLIGIIAHLVVISAYTIWSVAAIAIDLVGIYILWAYRRRR